MQTLSKLTVQRALSGAIAFVLATGASAAPLTLSNVPLYLTARADPNVLINLSVETPMGGAAYNDQPGTPLGCTGPTGTHPGRRNNVLGDSSANDIGTCYFANTTYLGYFDPRKCYSYDTANGRFNPAASANNDHSCSPAATYWSGNFLNWASMTAIDMFIWTMTGGNRVEDSTSLTVIRRARKHTSNSWFPRKVVNSTINVAPSSVMPFSDSTIFIHNTDFGMNLGTTFASATGGSPNRGSFQIKVKVCDSAIGLEPNCVAYNNGAYYKPEGLIQRHANQKRFGLTSYTLDNTQSRDGGVLRSKMKYVGPTRPIAGGGGTQANPVKEYGTDGILINNPDGASGGLNSGVINYINKFSDPGYKSYDPIGELFYEGLRYFKNLGPTPEYYSGITLDSSDSRTGGFQIITSWDDPIQYSCQKNFVVGINDANPWLDKRLPGTHFTSAPVNGYNLTANDYGEPSNADPAINVTTLTNTVGSLEGLNGTSQCVGGGYSDYNNSATNKTISGLGEVMGTCPHVPKQNSYYIAGLAFYANTTDLRLDLPGKQTVSTFMIDTQEYSTNPLTGQMNMLWLAGKYGGFIDANGNDRPDLTSEWDANGDGVPDNYVLATQPDRLVQGLSAAFVDIDSRTSTAAAVALNSSSLNTGTRIYQAQFNSGDWTGNLRALPIDETGVIGSPEWNAQTRLQSQDWNTGRNIFTHNGTRGVRFRWPSNPASPAADELSTSQVAALNAGDGYGSFRLNWMRGDNAKESVSQTPHLRRRDGNKLGDIAHSTPIYVGVPPYLPSLESTPHATFRNSSTVYNRAPMIYVGGNDGMLHGFDAATGDEKVAYVPAAVFPDLHHLTNPNYSHRYYVDGSPTVGDAFGDFAACTSSPCWRTILVGGLAGGGKGYFALDVTDPTAFTETSANAQKLALWEFTNSTDADMGYTYGQATIARMQDGSWRAIFGNGYNSASEKVVLYLLKLDWAANGTLEASEYTKITLDDVASAGNGLSAPAVVDIDGDYIADFIYAGDLKGNLWKVDVRGSNTGNWGSFYKSGSTPKPLFKAENPSGTPQPITSRPEVGKHPVNGVGGYMVYFGTGQYLQESDKSNTNVQSFYGIWDPSLTGGAAVSGTAKVPRAKLVAQTIGTAAVNGQTVRSITNNPIVSWDESGTCSASGSRCMGWYVDLPTSGERVTSNPQLVASGVPPRIIFTTMIPDDTPCSYGGESWLMELSPTNGGHLSYPVFDINEDGVFDSNDMIGGTTSVAGINPNLGIMPEPAILHDSANSRDLKISTGSSGNIESIANSAGGKKAGRQSWRQLR